MHIVKDVRFSRITQIHKSEVLKVLSLQLACQIVKVTIKRMIDGPQTILSFYSIVLYSQSCYFYPAWMTLNIPQVVSRYRKKNLVACSNVNIVALDYIFPIVCIVAVTVAM